MANETLVASMKTFLADSFALYLKAQNFHWNVEGANFYQYHKLFEDVYGEIYGSIDSIAEHIRALDAYAPGSLKRFSELTSVEEDNVIPTDIEMAQRLLADVVAIIATAKGIQKIADEAGEPGVSNFIQDRIDSFQKHAWMLRATGKTR